MNVNLKNFLIKIIVINASIIFLYYLISPYQICKRAINKSTFQYIIEDNLDSSLYCQNSKYFYMQENREAAILFLDFLKEKKEDKEKEDK